MNNQSKYISIFIAIIVMLGSFIANKHFNSSSFNDNLMKASEEINTQCPIMVDKETRLDNTLGGPGNRFTYNYSLINYHKEELDAQELINAMKPQLLNNVKINKELALFRDNKVEMIYVYNDKKGKEVARINIDPAEF